MADPKPLSRAQLAKFLPDHESIRRFEQMSAIVQQLAPDVINELNIAVANADSKAVLAIGLALSQDFISDEKASLALSLIDGITKDIQYHPQFIQDRIAEKSNRVLTWLSM